MCGLRGIDRLDGVDAGRADRDLRILDHILLLNADDCGRISGDVGGVGVDVQILIDILLQGDIYVVGVVGDLNVLSDILGFERVDAHRVAGNLRTLRLDGRIDRAHRGGVGGDLDVLSLILCDGILCKRRRLVDPDVLLDVLDQGGVGEIAHGIELADIDRIGRCDARREIDHAPFGTGSPDRDRVGRARHRTAADRDAVRSHSLRGVADRDRSRHGCVRRIANRDRRLAIGDRVGTDGDGGKTGRVIVGTERDCAPPGGGVGIANRNSTVANRHVSQADRNRSTAGGACTVTNCNGIRALRYRIAAD